MPVPNSFGTFLETLQGDSKSSVPDAPVAILKMLASSGQASVQELLSGLGMDVVELAKTLTGMKEAGLIELQGSGASQVVKLTQTGTAFLKIGK